MPDQLEEIFWDTLIPEIYAGRCVLVVGPDLVSFGTNQTIFQLLCQELEGHQTYGTLVNNSPYIFQHEELIQPKANGKDGWLYKFYRDFYAGRSEFDAPFLKIAQLPFHTVISLLPDQRLPGVFEEIGRPHEFAYYPCSEDNLKPAEVEPPTKDKPLIYNMLGTVGTTKKQKLECIITFDHLFTYLEGILSDKRPLPGELAQKLLRAQTVLFLGVQFERWYMQVLLRKLLPKNAPGEKYSLLRGNANSDVSIFITERLALKFLSIEPLDFLDELYRRCAAEDLLIPVQRKAKATVFVSYGHADKTPVDQLADKLRDAEIAVIRDEESMPVGERISRFMERVKQVDALVVVVSQNSLHSPFVGKEILYALDTPNAQGKPIRIIPCYLDKQFLAVDIAQTIHKGNNDKLQAIQEEISTRKRQNPLDQTIELEIEEKLRQEFGRNLDRLLAALRDSKQAALQLPDLQADAQPDIAAGAAHIIREILTPR